MLELEHENEVLRAELDQTRTAGAEAIERTHRTYRRDLVPVSQAMTLFGRNRSIFGDR